MLGLNDIEGFNGVWDEAGFEVVTVATAAEMSSAIPTSDAAIATRRVIVCNWNGDSETPGGTSNGPTDTQLTSAGFANPAADIGFDTPSGAVKIKAGVGFSPRMVASLGNNVLNLRGLPRVHIDGVDITGTVDLNSADVRVLKPIAAITNCDIAGSISATNCRVLHVENCTMLTASSSITAGIPFVRIFGNRFSGKTRAGDLLRASGMNRSWHAGKVQRVWLSHNFSWDNIFDDPSGNHFDTLQWTLPGETHLGTRIIAEFNAFIMNISSSQGLFGDDGGTGMVGEFIAHNNLIAINAFHAIAPEDRSGAGFVGIVNNTAVRSATENTSQQTQAGIRIWQDSATPPPQTGEYYVINNVANNIPANLVWSVTESGNLVLPVSDMPTFFAGDGSWGADATFGSVTYNDPGAGMAAGPAFQAVRDFYRPQAGYGNAPGITDPLLWPTGPQAVL